MEYIVSWKYLRQKTLLINHCLAKIFLNKFPYGNFYNVVGDINTVKEFSYE